MIKDIESKKFRDWYSSNLNETVTQDPENIDNYLNFKITKQNILKNLYLNVPLNYQ